jgi:hypothetical protein
MNFLERFMDLVMPPLTIILISLAVLCLIIYVPATLHAEQTCLAAGFPRANVTYNLEIYCTNLEGVVTYKVERK